MALRGVMRLSKKARRPSFCIWHYSQQVSGYAQGTSADFFRCGMAIAKEAFCCRENAFTVYSPNENKELIKN